MDKLNEIAETIRESIFKDNERTGNIVFGALLESVEHRPLPESIFRDYFLPCFLGLRRDQASINWMAEWVAVAGTAMSEVVIIDDYTKQELYKVPPILNTTSLYMTKTEGDLGDIAKRHSDISNNNPTAGLSFLIAALNQKSIDLTKSIDHGGILDRWVSIMNRYGYLVNYQNSTSESDTALAHQGLDNFLDY